MPAPIRTARAADGRAEGAPVWSSTEVTSEAGAGRHGDISQTEGARAEVSRRIPWASRGRWAGLGRAPRGRPPVGRTGGPSYDRHARRIAAPTCLGEWRSLVAHPAGGRAVAGSNPVSPTIGKTWYSALCSLTLVRASAPTGIKRGSISILRVRGWRAPGPNSHGVLAS